MPRALQLGVLEARWWDKGNHSVRPLFDALAGIHANNPFAYRYEMFSNHKSFHELLFTMGKSRTVRRVHIAAHGTDTGIQCSNESISRTKIRNAVLNLTIDGMFFGSCALGSKENARFFLARMDGHINKIKWVAGYEENVN